MSKRDEILDLRGQRFGELVVQRLVSRGPTRWKCRCDCGHATTATSASLKAGKVKSCGCRRRRVSEESHLRHGCTRRGRHLPEYTNWCTMKQRCLNPNNPSYKNYGERGITICNAWRDSFEAFLSDMGARPSPKHNTVERKDNERGYEPGNCVWATRHVQITLNGETRHLMEWARILGINYTTIQARLLRGWPPERALSPV